MQTNETSRQATVVLKDGHTRLATWNHAFGQRPTIGESIELPDHLTQDLSGYGGRAPVSRIELRGDLPDLIELEARCPVKPEDRPVVVLNADRIRESLRVDAERHLRSTLRFPLVTWEPSTLPDPVVRFHDPASGRKACPPDVRSGLLDLIYQPTSV